MADDSTLDLLIKLNVIGKADAIAARDLLNETGAAAQQAGNKAISVNADDAKGTDQLVLKKRELAHVINALGGQAIPEMGKALSMLAYGAGPAAAIFALVGAFEMIKHHLDAVKKAAADVLELKWETMRDSVKDTVESTHNLEDALEKASKPADKIKTAFEAQKALIEAEIADHKKLLDAFEQEELAAAKGDKDKEASIRARYADLKREYDLSAEQLKIDQLSYDIDHRKTEQFKLRHEFYAAQKAVGAAETDPELMAAQQALKGKDRATLIAANGGDQYSSDVDARIAATKADSSLSFDQAFRRMQKLNAEKALLEFDKNTQIVAEHTESIRRLKSKVDEADAAAVANTTAITEETSQRDSAIPVLREHQTAAAQQSAIAKVTAAGGVDSALSGGLNAIDALAHGQKLDQKGQQAYQAFRAVFDSVHGQFDKILSLEMSNARLHQSHTQRIAELEAWYKNLLSLATRPKS